MALTKIGATLGGSADVIHVTQNSHGLSLGFPVKVSGNGTYAHASADSAANAEAIGIIIAITTNTLTIALGGKITIDGVLPSGNLAAGTVLFLSTSAAKLTAVEPSSTNQVSKPMAVVTYLNSEMIMIQHRGEVIGDGSSTITDNSITNAKMADDAIDSDELAAGSVDFAHMSVNSINSDQYVDGSIDRVHLAADIIDGTKIADDVIDSEHYAAASIDNEHLADDAVGADELAANAVVNASIASGAAINFSKMENLTNSRALVSDGSGDVSVSAVTSTEVGYLDGVSSAIQTQLGTKSPIASPTFTTGATSPAWITGNNGTIKFNDSDGSHYFTLAANATTTTSVAYTWPDNAPGTSGFALTSTTAGVMSWAAAGGKGTIQVHPQSYSGTYRVETQGDLPITALGTDSADGTIGYSFQLPHDLASIEECFVVYMNMGNSLAIGISCTTDFGQINESRTANSDSIATAYAAKSINTFAEYDITAALTGATAGDHVGIKVTREGADGSDLAGDVGFAHLVLEYNK